MLAIKSDTFPKTQEIHFMTLKQKKKILIDLEGIY